MSNTYTCEGNKLLTQNKICGRIILTRGDNLQNNNLTTYPFIIAVSSKTAGTVPDWRGIK